MKRHTKFALVIGVLLATMLLVCACSSDQSPYAGYDEEGYNVSVRFDANGGSFTTNVSVITDVFDISKMETDSDGNVSIPLLAPTKDNRGDSVKPTLEDHFLVGWYAVREDDPDGEGYVYSDQWDFEQDRLTVAASAEHSSAEPVLTLYAVWAPMLQVNVYDLADGSLVDSFTYDPNVESVLTMPHWNEKKGTIDMEDFPKKDGYTFNAAYLDADGTQQITSDTLEHSYQVDRQTGEVTGTEMAIYVDWLEGDWYHIYDVKQFQQNASISGNYEIMADLDFTGTYWPTTFMNNNFSGTINGNGHTFSNIAVEQTQTHNKLYTGLFGNVTADAKISDLTLDNVTFLIQGGSRTAGASFGLLAGAINEDAQIENLQIINSTLQISSDIYYAAGTDYAFGKVCALGYNAEVISAAGIEVEAVNVPAASGALTYKEVVITQINENEFDIEVVTKTVGETPGDTDAAA